jgi:hypothetical protein
MEPYVRSKYPGGQPSSSGVFGLADPLTAGFGVNTIWTSYSAPAGPAGRDS